MARIYNSITELIGNTPLIDISEAAARHGSNARVLAKIEAFNPLGSVKDRAALSMILDAEQSGQIKEGSNVVEATSGNTGIGLAYICAVRGYKCTIVMPDTMSVERCNLLKALGATLELTPGSKGMTGAIDRANEIAEEDPKAVMIRQFDNPANPAIHYKTTGEEIWSDTDGEVDIFVAGVGTGGTITGVSGLLKSKKPGVIAVAVEPDSSAVLSGGQACNHKIQGIGAGFVPKILKRELIDEIVRVKNEDAFAMAREIALREGILVGISSGAALWAAYNVASRPENRGKTIVVMLPDSGERYLSTALFQD